MERLVRQQNVSPVAVGQKRLAANDMHGTNAALLYEGRIPVGKETLDAVIIEVRAYSHPDLPATIAVPYTPAASGQFRVHMPKLLVWNDSDQKMAAAMEAFFGGIAANAEGARIWNSSLDESK